MMVASSLCFAAFTLACVDPEDSDSESESDWLIEDLTLAPDGLNYAEISGTVTLNADFSTGGTAAEVRFYSDNYDTLIVATSDTIGADLEDVGTRQEFDITHFEVFVLPATGGYDRVCAEFRADDSNYDEFTEVGCLDGP